MALRNLLQLIKKVINYVPRKVIQIKHLFFWPLSDLIYVILVILKKSYTINSKISIENTTKHVKKEKLDFIICTVVGPGSGQLLGLKDLLDSARCYIDGKYKIIVVDDSVGLRAVMLCKNYKEVDCLRNWRPNGIKGLYQSLLKAYIYALKHYEFQALIKMDTDAMIIGQGLVNDVISYFTAHPEAGMLGSYRKTCTGTLRDFLPAVDQFKRSWDTWKDLIEEAQKKGYELGENVQGGAYIISYQCLKKIYDNGYLIDRRNSFYISEDFIFSLYVRAAGYEIHDFATNGKPFAIAWRGLPISKEEAVKLNKKVIHSVKFTSEDIEIRDYFRKIREAL